MLGLDIGANSDWDLGLGVEALLFTIILLNKLKKM